jgi:hypothetical protein
VTWRIEVLMSGRWVTLDWAHGLTDQREIEAARAKAAGQFGADRVRVRSNLQ